MGKKVIFIFITVLFFMIYTVVFHKPFSVIPMIEILVPYGSFCSSLRSSSPL
jgi:hypothetical protein